MFAQWKEKRQKKREERRQRKAERQKEWEEKLLNSRRVSFCLQDVEFMDYALPFHLTACGNELSLYETDEKSYNDEVIGIFREIAEEVAQGYAVMHWLRWSDPTPLPAIKKYQAGEGAVFDDHFIVKCSENGLDAYMMDLQMRKENHWNFIEQECYGFREMQNPFQTIADAAEYIEKVPCDLYIMIDLMHGALMVKTRKKEDLEKVEECMRRICDKHEKFVYDYIGRWQ